MYERHLVPPADFLYFDFDLTEKFRKRGIGGMATGGMLVQPILTNP